MFFYIVRRLVSVVVMLLVISATTFLIFFASPIDPASLTCGKSCTPAVIEGNRIKMGYDKPVPVQWFNFLKGLFVGADYPADPEVKAKTPQLVTHCDAPSLGYSTVKTKCVTDIVKEALPITASIAIGAFVMWIVTGVLFGIIAALNRGRWPDRLLVGLALVGYSVPSFFIGVLLLTFVSIKWQLWPLPVYTSFSDNPLLWAQGIFLPSLALAAVFAASYVRLTRAYMLETMSEDYIRTARAKGLSERRVVVRHGLRSSLTPLVTMIGMDLGALLGGAIITETVFNLPGIGALVVQSVSNNDFNAILDVTIVAALAVTLMNLLVDIVYAYLDPRVRYT